MFVVGKVGVDCVLGPELEGRECFIVVEVEEKIFEVVGECIGDIEG